MHPGECEGGPGLARFVMKIGIPREIKFHEYRVAIVPAGVEELVEAGHRVLLEREAGVGSGIEDEEYRACGAEIHDDPIVKTGIDIAHGKILNPAIEEG